MRRFAVILCGMVSLALLAGGGIARADGEQSTPKGALKYFDRVAGDPNVDRADVFYYAKTEDERKIAKAFASVDFALAKLKKIAAARWDSKASDAMAHAVRDVTPEDIDAARESVEGDRATITGKGFDSPLPMIKVDGAWRISIPDAMKLSQATPQQIEQACTALVDAIEKTQEELQANKYANPSLLDRAMKRRVRGILGGS
jgi:hypothetical protein